MSVAETDDVTALVVIVKVAVLLPAATVTEAGALAALLLLESETDTPPVGAAPLRVSVPVAEAPALTLEGLTETEDNDTPAFDVRGIVTVEPAAMTTLS